MRLALAMGKTLSELNGSLSRDEWKLWIAYNRIEPIPEPWLQTGITCSTLANVWGNKTTCADFMPVVKPKVKRKQTGGEIRKVMDAWQINEKKKMKDAAQTR